MADMKTPAIVALTPTALETAEAVRRALGVAEIHGLAGRIVSCGVAFEDTAAHLCALFAEGRPIIAVFSVGALVRLLCEALEDKRTEPPVLAVSQDGASIVPVLGGHHGANRMARDIADALNAHAAVTAAGDLRFGVALDDPPGRLQIRRARSRSWPTFWPAPLRGWREMRRGSAGQDFRSVPTAASVSR